VAAFTQSLSLIMNYVTDDVILLVTFYFQLGTIFNQLETLRLFLLHDKLQPAICVYIYVVGS